jgi:hypothetical protein
MEYFWSDGGNNRPDFTYRYTMKEVTSEMYRWCQSYPANGPFDRFHVIRNYGQPTDGDKKEIPLIQFENKKAAFMFSIAFSEYILEDKTYSFAKEWK